MYEKQAKYRTQTTGLTFYHITLLKNQYFKAWRIFFFKYVIKDEFG